MTEWEKLQTGQLYNDFDRGLFKRRIAAKRLFRAYNRTDDDEQTERRALMEQLFGSVGKNVWIEPDFRCEFGKNITIEDNVYINFGCVILDWRRCDHRRRQPPWAEHRTLCRQPCHRR